ncbi:unnamed protein product [Caenorhabditis bovis]|uniref:Uncharacterized protein n=1 Tax=Caenorhabditis bovis TaxID=2654633 RepID=A0A8S1F058_9PELO|nr:unnamed protein product [Caenorhabditis bovis]
MHERPRHVSVYRHAPKIFGLRFKVASRVLLTFEAILGKLLLVISICSIIYSHSWYPVFVNFSFFAFVVFSIINYNKSLSSKSCILLFPMLTYQVVTMTWLVLWIYASLNAVMIGDFDALKWLGGPQEDVVPTASHPYEPYKNNPNRAKAIKYGSIIFALTMLIIVLKIFAFIIAKRTFFQIQKMQIEEMLEEDKANCETASEISNIGGLSPSFPIAYRNRPPRMEVVDEVMVEEYPPTPSPVPRRYAIPKFGESTI